MKTSTLFVIFVLVFGTVSPLLLDDAHAQNNPNILLRIAQQADKQIKNQLDRIYQDNIPQEIQELYDQGHASVESLEKSLESNNIEQAKKDFLVAMKSFQQISRMIVEPTTETRTTANTLDRNLTSELNRLHKYFQNLKSISERYDTGINFDHIDELFTQGREQLNSGDIEGAKATIDELKSLINDIQKNIREHASNNAIKKAKEFLAKQLERIQTILEKYDPENQDVKVAIGLIDDIEHSLSEDNIPDAKKKFVELIRLVNTIQKSNR